MWVPLFSTSVLRQQHSIFVSNLIDKNWSICLAMSSYALLSQAGSLTIINTEIAERMDGQDKHLLRPSICRDVGLIENVNVFVRLWGRINSDSIIFIVSSFYFLSPGTESVTVAAKANPVCKLPTFTYCSISLEVSLCAHLGRQCTFRLQSHVHRPDLDNTGCQLVFSIFSYFFTAMAITAALS